VSKVVKGNTAFKKSAGYIVIIWIKQMNIVMFSYSFMPGRLSRNLLNQNINTLKGFFNFNFLGSHL
jgi:hypothetical protein